VFLICSVSSQAPTPASGRPVEGGEAIACDGAQGRP